MITTENLKKAVCSLTAKSEIYHIRAALMVIVEYLEQKEKAVE